MRFLSTVRDHLHAASQRWRFAAVLVASLMLAVAHPLVASQIGDERAFDLFFSLLIVTVMVMVFEQREHRRVALTVALLSLGGLSVGHGVGDPEGRFIVIGSQLLGAGFFLFALYGILRAVLGQAVSGDALLGAVCGYVLVGVIWSLLYFAIETSFPGSFQLSEGLRAEGKSRLPDRELLSYYSFVTLTTVGYGDVTPATPFVRTLAWMEALIGQLYLAIFVAGLVGYRVSSHDSPSRDSVARLSES